MSMPQPVNQPRRGPIWATRLGLVMIAFGVLLLTPASDLLPVELWLYLQHPFGSSPHEFLRSVPSEGNSQLPVFAITGAALITFGLALVGLVLLLRTEGGRNDAA